jgi:hypothetical protein
MLAGDEKYEAFAAARKVEDEAAINRCAGRLAQVVEAAESLAPDDRVRLITRLWKSLPSKHRAEIIWFGIENLQTSDQANTGPAVQKPAEPPGFDLHRLLFDPSNTSELYSAPRRFDLATIFVVTAAYSILFGAISALSYKDMGPAAEIAVGVLVTLVGLAQAFYKDTANPRGVSIVAGAVVQTTILIVIHIAEPRIFGESIVLILFFGGLIGGAFCGYLAGVLVGGVFLVADLIRQKFGKPSETEHEEPPSRNN